MAKVSRKSHDLHKYHLGGLKGDYPRYSQSSVYFAKTTFFKSTNATKSQHVDCAEWKEPTAFVAGLGAKIPIQQRPL